MIILPPHFQPLPLEQSYLYYKNKEIKSMLYSTVKVNVTGSGGGGSERKQQANSAATGDRDYVIYTCSARAAGSQPQPSHLQGAMSSFFVFFCPVFV